MFARKMNEPHGFRSDKDKLKQVEGKPPMSHEELMKRIDYMTDIVFPAIVDKTKAQVELEQAKFNDSHKLVDYAPGSHVMDPIQLYVKMLEMRIFYVMKLVF
ncbi:hypothetical protein G6F59_018242 [Rhizopus arrhizus]|nr:hypothetical protein G6F59_018242 [Rhizopus arrhizus]